VLIKAEAPELALVHRWPDNWRGVGLLVEGLHRTQYGDNTFRATFYITGIAHSIRRWQRVGVDARGTHSAGGVGGYRRPRSIRREGG
jgi:hypothetical protein